MQRISQSEFIASRADYDRAVENTPEIFRFCSSSTWCLAARRHLIGLGEDDSEEAETALKLPADALRGDTAIWRDESRTHWLVFGRSRWGYWEPFEASWLFTCPLVGPHPEAVLGRLESLVKQDPDLSPGFAIGGIPANGRLHRALRRREAAGRFRQYQEHPGTDCLTIDLAGGPESWLARRSRKFRRSLKGAERKCRESGLSLEFVEEGSESSDAIFARMQALQPRTAKWASGTDIFQSESYCRFYASMLRDLRERDQLRAIFAVREGIDVAYLFGARFGDAFRGLQMSYVEEAAGLGVGNWLQWESLKRRALERVRDYDLGMDADYKRRWADRRRNQLATFLVPGG